MSQPLTPPKTTHHLDALRGLVTGETPTAADRHADRVHRQAPKDDETFTTLDLTAKYFKPIWNALLHASAKVIKCTRTLCLIECDITDEAGSLVAKIYSSCMVLRGHDARGR